LLLLMAVHYDLTVIESSGIILLIGIVKKKRHHAGRFCPAGRNEKGLSAKSRSIRLACCASADPDDDDGGIAPAASDDAWYRGRLGASQPLGYAIVGGLLCRRF